MKKTFCVLLAFLMLLPFCPVNSAVASLSDASLAFDGGGLVTLGRPYTVSLGQAAYCSGNGDDLGIKLTDYRFAGAISPQPEEEWVGFDAAGAVFTVEIVIELASAATGLFSFCADFAAYSTNGIYLPSKVEFLGSTDGAGYTLLGEGKLDTLDNGTVSRCSYTTTEHVSLRYLKTRITGSGKVFVDEIFAVRHGLLSQTGSLVYDTQGLVYELRGDSAAVVGYDPSVTLGGDAVTPVIPTPADGLTDGVTYTIGRGSEAQTEVIAQFLDPARPNHPNMSTPDKKYIVIHNTGNYSDGADASANHRYMLFNTDCEASWHYTVDKDVIYQALSDYTTGYHSSDGAYGAGNYYGIGVEICVNGFPGTYSGDAYEAWLEDSFLPAVRRAAMLTAELCVRHGLDPATAIRQHYDSNGKNCPMQMRYTSSLGGYTRDDGDVWKQFIGWVNDDYRALTGGTAAAYESVGRLTVPDSITVSGRDYPVTAVEEDAFAAAPESVFLGANVQNLPSAVRGVTTISPQNSHISAVMPAALPDSGVVIADGLVKGLYTGTTAGALLSKLEDGPTLYDASGEPKADADAVATGDYFKSPNGRLYVVVTGDLNGDRAHHRLRLSAAQALCAAYVGAFRAPDRGGQGGRRRPSGRLGLFAAQARRALRRQFRARGGNAHRDQLCVYEGRLGLAVRPRAAAVRIGQPARGERAADAGGTAVRQYKKGRLQHRLYAGASVRGQLRALALLSGFVVCDGAPTAARSTMIRWPFWWMRRTRAACLSTRGSIPTG